MIQRDKIKELELENKRLKQEISELRGKMMESNDVLAVNNMLQYGGSFVQALGNTAIHADPINFKKLKSAFSDYFDEYFKFNNSAISQAINPAVSREN